MKLLISVLIPGAAGFLFFAAMAAGASGHAETESLGRFRHHLGVSDPARIDLVKLGWAEEILI